MYLSTVSISSSLFLVEIDSRYDKQRTVCNLNYISDKLLKS